MKKFLIIWMLAAGAFCAAEIVNARPVTDVRKHTVSGVTYYSLRDLAKHYGMTIRIPPGKHVYLRSNWSEFAFEVDSRSASFNGISVWLHRSMIRHRGKWLLGREDAEDMVDALLMARDHLKSKGHRVVVLDPGHGGNDNGACGKRNVQEKRVVLDVANRARVYLANAGLKVYLTRETDRYISLTERTAKAKKWGADLFVSIHLNSAGSSSASGVETYALALQGCPPTSRPTPSKSDRYAYAGNRHDQANAVLGYHMQKALVEKVGGKDRGLRRARFVVLKNAPCPAALIECGFLSNAEEERKMLDRKHRDRIALAITQGVLDYVKSVQNAKLSD